MKKQGILLTILCIAAILLSCGCVQKGTDETKTNATQMPTTQNASTEPQAKVRYVQLNFLDGTSAGGKYVSETAAFTTIELMYTFDPSAYTRIVNENLSGDTYVLVKDPDRYLVKENGNTVSFKNSLINTMVEIEDPTLMIEKTQQELRDIKASDKLAREKRGWPVQ